MPGAKPHLHLPYGQWPPEDRRRWEHAVSGDDPFADGAGAHLAATSRKAYLFGWRRFLGFLVLAEPEALELPPAERLTAERVRRFASHLFETNLPQSVAGQVDMLYKAARIMVPTHNWSWLKSIKARLFAVPPVHNSTKPVITSLQLLELGLQLMDENRPVSGAPTSLDAAVKYRDGLMIALLACIPVRRKNFAAIEIDRHLIREDDTFLIILPRDETKTHTADEFVVPELLVPYLKTYLEIVRPRLLRSSSCSALWISRNGAQISYSVLGPVVARHSVARLGLHIAPHDFRDAAATTWAIAMPKEIGVAGELLSHADLRTTTKHYNRAKGIEASRAHARLIASLRRSR